MRKQKHIKTPTQRSYFHMPEPTHVLDGLIFLFIIIATRLRGNLGENWFSTFCCCHHHHHQHDDHDEILQMSGVKVAVRVRPFNSRELARDAESIITSEIIIMTVIIMMIMMMLRIMRMMRITMILPEMHSPSSSYYCHTHNNDIPVEGATTRIKNPKAGNATDAIKSFNFDYSYWSKEVSGSTEPFAFLTSTPKDEKKCIILQVAGQHTYAFLCIFNIHGPRRHGNGY